MPYGVIYAAYVLLCNWDGLGLGIILFGVC